MRPSVKAWAPSLPVYPSVTMDSLGDGLPTKVRRCKALEAVETCLPLRDLKSIHLCQLFGGGGLSMVKVSLSIVYPSVTMDSLGGGLPTRYGILRGQKLPNDDVKVLMHTCHFW